MITDALFLNARLAPGHLRPLTVSTAKRYECRKVRCDPNKLEIPGFQPIEALNRFNSLKI